MRMSYCVRTIPDPNRSLLRQGYGNPFKVLSDGWKSLLRMLSEFPEDYSTIVLSLHYTPEFKTGVQGRLALFIEVEAEDEEKAHIIDSLITGGPISDFYQIEKLETLGKAALDYAWAAVGEIVRRFEVLPSIGKEKNERVPQFYYTVSQFRPNDGNSYMALDRQLSKLDVPVTMRISVRPVRVEEETKSLYLYLSNLSKINEQVFLAATTVEDKMRAEKGFTKDQLASEVMQDIEALLKLMRVPQLTFSIRVYSTDRSVVQLACSTIAENAFVDGSYRILLKSSDEEGFGAHLEKITQAPILHDWHHLVNLPERLKRMPRIASVEELSGLFRLPVGELVSPRTIRKDTDPPVLHSIKNTLLIGDDMEMGVDPKRNFGGDMVSLFDVPSLTTIEHRLSLDLLKKHMFISGVPGSGKTTAVFNLLVQLYRAGIPFFAIEPVKTEYRILKTLKRHGEDILTRLGSQVRIYTPGNDQVSPLRFNPLSFPEGISLDEHMNNLMNCFMATMPMEGPLPALLAEALEKVYDQYEEPCLSDLVDMVRAIMGDKKYDAEVKGNLETAITVRLSPLVRRSMGKVFAKSADAISITELMTLPVIIEMDSLNQEQANVLSLFLLTSIREHIKTTRRSGSPLCHVIVLEEAHNIVGRLPESGSDGNDPREKAAQYVTRMLAELRALGEGMIIADQLPSTVAESVIKNTGIKLAHRLTSIDDRESLGYTMLAGLTEIEEFARLRVGEAFYYSEGLYRCRRVKCINSNAFLKFSQPPENKILYDLLIDEAWFRPAGLKHLEEEMKEVLDYFHRASDALNELEKMLINWEGNWDELDGIKESFIDLFEEISEKEILSILDGFSVRMKQLNAPIPYNAFYESLVAEYQQGILGNQANFARILDSIEKDNNRSKS